MSGVFAGAFIQLVGVKSIETNSPLYISSRFEASSSSTGLPCPKACTLGPACCKIEEKSKQIGSEITHATCSPSELETVCGDDGRPIIRQALFAHSNTSATLSLACSEFFNTEFESSSA